MENCLFFSVFPSGRIEFTDSWLLLVFSMEHLKLLPNSNWTLLAKVDFYGPPNRGPKIHLDPFRFRPPSGLRSILQAGWNQAGGESWGHLSSWDVSFFMLEIMLSETWFWCVEVSTCYGNYLLSYATDIPPICDYPWKTSSRCHKFCHIQMPVQQTWVAKRKHKAWAKSFPERKKLIGEVRAVFHWTGIFFFSLENHGSVKQKSPLSWQRLIFQGGIFHFRLP